ncbi:AEC family transporter [Salidesulfovibrio brasiliensis]|uniref:AEC family transporter n=1 Tax=Salidesulfovibrio brasiliensis TaxID=221711 RepID=UPI0006D06595|nr:AEC family transporter [Salidesulfovibrio brasiliensis]
MHEVLLAVAPVFFLILVGLLLHRMDFPSRDFWPASERLTYYVLFPAMLVSGLSGRQFGAEMLTLALSVGGALIIVATLMLALRPRLSVTGPVFTSLFQGSIRPNTYVALSLAAALLGPDWMRLSAVALLVSIPLVNVLCVIVLARHGTNLATGPLGIVRQLVGNPLILACVLGLTLNALNLTLPETVHSLLRITGSAALPMGLLAVGAGLRPSATVGHLRPALTSSAAHLILLPLVALCIGFLLGGTELSLRAAVIFTAIPVSASSFILARQMGGDHEAMAAVITVQTALSAFTIPIILAAVG